MGDTDIGWKESLEAYLEQAMALLFPQAHAEIDWSRPPEFLDKELQQIVREGELGTRLLDKLAKVWLKNGEERWVLLHVEVQGEPQEQFGFRMYVYNFRIVDRYNRRVASFAILADDRPEWRPGGHSEALLGCTTEFRFPTVKLLDFATRKAELEANPNPFAVVILAYLSARETRGDDNLRRTSKIRLIRSLFERGLDRLDVQRLFRLIHWFMVLPEELENEVWQEVERIQQEKQMEHITTIEKIWMKRGRIEGEESGRAEGEARSRATFEAAIEHTLHMKFGATSTAALMPRVRVLTITQLGALLPSIVAAATPEVLLQNVLDLR